MTFPPAATQAPSQPSEAPTAEAAAVSQALQSKASQAIRQAHVESAEGPSAAAAATQPSMQPCVPVQSTSTSSPMACKPWLPSTEGTLPYLDTPMQSNPIPVVPLQGTLSSQVTPSQHAEATLSAQQTRATKAPQPALVPATPASLTRTAVPAAALPRNPVDFPCQGCRSNPLHALTHPRCKLRKHWRQSYPAPHHLSLHILQHCQIHHRQPVHQQEAQTLVTWLLLVCRPPARLMTLT